MKPACPWSTFCTAPMGISVPGSVTAISSGMPRNGAAPWSWPRPATTSIRTCIEEAPTAPFLRKNFLCSSQVCFLFPKKGRTPTLPGSPWAATEPGTWPCQPPICMQKLPACPVRWTLRFYIGRHRMALLITHFHGMISSRTRKRFPAVTGICSHCMNSAGKTIRPPACIRPAGPGISYMI